MKLLGKKALVTGRKREALAVAVVRSSHGPSRGRCRETQTPKLSRLDNRIERGVEHTFINSRSQLAASEGDPDTDAPERHGPALGTPILRPTRSSNVLMAKGFQT